MLRLPCVWCGVRDENEFHHGGPVLALSSQEGITDRQWSEYLFGRDNPRGPVQEYWFHEGGCRQWLILVRDTVSNEVLSVVPARNRQRSGTGGASS